MNWVLLVALLRFGPHIVYDYYPDSASCVAMANAWIRQAELWRDRSGIDFEYGPLAICQPQELQAEAERFYGATR